jgi:nucleoid DNA-binding protein/nucleoid-associated protein YgaU
MSKDKISSQEIIDLVSSKAAVSKRAAEEFLKVMISTIEDALIAGEIVKIKNFGTFKLQWNEPRKSVNVQTGEDIILSGYHKVSFTPDTQLRDLVNEPFAHLEPFSLDDELIGPVSVGTEPVLDPLRTLNEQASEIKDILAQINGLSKNIQVEDYFKIEEAETNEPIKVEEIKEEEIDLELPKQVLQEERAEIEEIQQEEEIQQIEEIQSVQQSNVTQIEEPVFHETIYNQPIEEDTEIIVISNPEELKPKKRKAWLWVLIILLVLTGSGFGLYYFYPPINRFVDSNYNKAKFSVLKSSENISMTDMLNTVSGWFISKPKKVEVPETVVIPKDTSSMDSIELKPQVDSLQLLFDNPRVYTVFVGSERIKRGSRLTIMSRRYYGNKNFWVYIYEANRDHIPNPDDIPVGTLIKIPKLDPRLIDASNEHCIQKAKQLHDIYVK